MSAVDYEAWIAKIHQKANRFGVIFLQLGSSNEPARRALMSAQTDTRSIRDYMTSDHQAAGGVSIIDAVETLTTANSIVSMGALRERVFEHVEAGARVVLLSRSPRIAFPAVVGSSLLDDASFAHAPVVSLKSADRLPTCIEDGEDPAEVLRRVLRELGPEVCGSLDRTVYENMLTGSDALRTLKARELEALDGAGITAPLVEGRTWNFPPHLTPLKVALAEVLSDVVDAQHHLGDVSAGLWKIERIIRREIRSRAIAAWASKWRQQCLNADLASKVLERAGEEAYLGATSIKQLRDPLEWLSLGELLQLKDIREIGDLGLDAAFWRRFASQIMPIRNRLAHMRTLRPDDSVNVVKWQRVLELRLR